MIHLGTLLDEVRAAAGEKGLVVSLTFWGLLSKIGANAQAGKGLSREKDTGDGRGDGGGEVAGGESAANLPIVIDFKNNESNFRSRKKTKRERKKLAGAPGWTSPPERVDESGAEIREGLS